MSAPKPKHPMEVVEQEQQRCIDWESPTVSQEINIERARVLSELKESVRYYFSEANMPSDEEIEYFARQDLLTNLDEEPAWCKGYKAALKRLKWKT